MLPIASLNTTDEISADKPVNFSMTLTFFIVATVSIDNVSADILVAERLDANSYVSTVMLVADKSSIVEFDIDALLALMSAMLALMLIDNVFALIVSLDKCYPLNVSEYTKSCAINFDVEMLFLTLISLAYRPLIADGAVVNVVAALIVNEPLNVLLPSITLSFDNLNES